MDQRQGDHLRDGDDRPPEQQLVQRHPFAEPAVEEEYRDEADDEGRVIDAVDDLVRVQLVLQIIEQRGVRARGELEQEQAAHGRIDGAVAEQPLEIAEEIGPARQRRLIGSPEYRARLPGPDQGDRQRDRRDHHEGLAGLQVSGDPAAADGRDRGRDRFHDLPDDRQPTAHQLLLTDEGQKPLLGGLEEARGDHRQQHADEQAHVAERRHGEPGEQHRRHGSEDQQEAAVAPSQRVPVVADQAEDEGEIGRDPGEQAKVRDRVCAHVQLVLQHVRGGEVDQVARRRGQVEDQRQHREVAEDLRGLLRAGVPGRGLRHAGILALERVSWRPAVRAGAVSGKARVARSETATATVRYQAGVRVLCV